MERDQEREIEQDVSRALSQYYCDVDQRQYEAAAALYTEDAEWQSLGVVLCGREAILKALYGGLADGTVRHIKTNALVNVIDEDHAQARWMNTVYYTSDSRIEDQDGPLPFEGPHRLQDFRANFVRTAEGWRIEMRDSSLIFRRNLDEPVAIETWAKSEGKADGG